MYTIDQPVFWLSGTTYKHGIVEGIRTEVLPNKTTTEVKIKGRYRNADTVFATREEALAKINDLIIRKSEGPVSDPDPTPIVDDDNE